MVPHRKFDNTPVETSSLTPRPGPATHSQSEYVVAVLGVMYPSVLPQLVPARPHLDLVLLPPGVSYGRQSVEVPFTIRCLLVGTVTSHA